LIEQLGFGDRISIVQFGGQTQVVCNLTSDYSLLRRRIASLTATGGTPMAEGLALGIIQLKNARPVKLGRHLIMPRVILMTDGAPDDKTKVFQIARQIGQTTIPVCCVGVSSCDRNVMETIAQTTGGMFVMADDLALLQLFFVRQVLLIVYLQKMQDSLQNLLNRELLRQFLEQQTESSVSDHELDGFIFLMQHLAKDDEDDGPTIVDMDSDSPLITSGPKSRANYSGSGHVVSPGKDEEPGCCLACLICVCCCPCLFCGCCSSN